MLCTVQKLSKIAVSLGTLVDPLPKNVLMAFASQLKSTEKDRVIPEANLSKVDQKLVSTLLPFQRDGIKLVAVFKSDLSVASC